MQEGKPVLPSQKLKKGGNTAGCRLSLLMKANATERTFVWEKNTLGPKHALQLRWCVISGVIRKTKRWTPRPLGALTLLTSQGRVWS